MTTLGTAGRTLNDGLKPSLYSHRKQRLGGQPEDKGKEGKETSQLVSSKARTGAPCPPSRSGALSSEGNPVGSESPRGQEGVQH